MPPFVPKIVVSNPMVYLLYKYVIELKILLLGKFYVKYKTHP
jgi:hypothetical protein